MPMTHPSRGYTLIELVVAVGLFALIMTLVAGAYLVMIGLIHHTQGMASGIDNLSFGLETMTRDIRTGTAYGCDVPNSANSDCPYGGSTFYFVPMGQPGESASYSLSTEKNANGVPMGVLTKTTQTAQGISTEPLTDPSAVDITSLKFYLTGSKPGDAYQPYVTMVVSGKIISDEPDDPSQSFTVETSAAMRGTDL